MTFVIDLALLRAAAVGLLVGAAVTAACLVVIHRRRVKRRDKSKFHIPPFLRGTADPGDDADRRFNGNWTEIHPLPKRISRGDD